MKLVNVSKKGTLKFRLNPIIKVREYFQNGKLQRIEEIEVKHVYSYNSGYVRIDCNDRIYQINKVRKVYDCSEDSPKIPHGNYDYRNERILILNPQERFNYLVSWVERFYKRNTN